LQRTTSVRPVEIADLDDILERCPSWEDLRGARVLLTGGTGFVGTWLLEAFAHADRRLGLGLKVRALSRNPDAFLSRHPHFVGASWLEWQTGDVFGLVPDGSHYTHVIHGATVASSPQNQLLPRVVFDTQLEGAKRTLELAIASRTERFLLLSSGAVYGRQPPELTHVPETYLGGPDPLDARSAYAEGKRAAEWLTCASARQHGFGAPIARCFAIVGPYLPLDAKLAIGNFIRDGLAGKAMRISGDGTTRRSYLYASDLVAWLITVLVRGDSGVAYNVGSEHDVSIAETAHALCGHFSTTYEIASKPAGAHPERFVPSTERARKQLGLAQHVSFAEAIAKTASYYLG
jgi:dTDP-glucose 4,6-dehydratase